MWSVVLFCFFLALCFVWRSRRNCGPQPPRLPGALPIIGHAYILLFIPEKYLLDLLKAVIKYARQTIKSDVFTLQVGPYTSYVLTDPDDCLTVANKCLQKYYTYNFLKRWIGSGLLTSDAELWKRHRKLINPAFSFTVLNEFMPVFNENSRELMKELASQVGKGRFKPDRFIIDFVLATTCQTTLHFNSSEDVTKKYEYMRDTEEIFAIFLQRICKFWLHNEFVYKWSSLKKREDKLIEMQKLVVKTIVDRKKSELSQTMVKQGLDDDIGCKNKPLLDLLLQIHDKDAFTEEELIHHLNTGIVGSYDTTFKAILNILLLVGSYPEVQEKIYEELHKIFGDSSRDVDKEDLAKLVYLEAVIKETLRLYPVSPYLGRTSDKEVKLKNYTLPAGSDITLLAYAVNRHAIWGSDAEVYRPERWLEPRGIPNNPNAFTAFGIGKRNCIGKRYAMMLLKTSLAHLLRQYRVTGDVTKLKVKFDFMMTPVSGHEISLEIRN